MPSIKYRIALEGGEQVKSELLTVEQAVKQLQNAAKSGAGADTFASTTAAISTLGSTSKEAFTAAAAAAQKFGASASELARVETIISALGARAKDSGTSFAQLAQNYDKARASASSAGQAMAGAATAQEKLAASTARIATGSGQAATALRLLAGEVRTVSAALATAGVPIGGLASTLSTMAVAAAGAGPALGGLAIVVAAVSAGVIGGVAALAKFAEGAKETVDALSRLSEKGDSSFQFISSMQQAFAQGGVSLNDFAKSYENLRNQLAQARPTALNDLAASADKAAQATQSVKDAIQSVTEAQLRLNNAQKAARGQSTELTQAEKAKADQARKNQAVQNARRQLEAAERQESEARRQEAVADANNLDTLAGKYQKLSQGIQQNFDPLTTLESKAKALMAMLAGGGQELGPFSEKLDEIGTKAERDAAALDKLADVFKNIKDETERQQLGQKLGLSPDFVRRLSLGSDALRRIRDDVRQAGLALNDFDRQNIEKFKESQATLGAIFDALRDKMGALASPAFTSFFEGLTDRIRELSPEFQKLAQAFGQLDFSAAGKAVGDLALKFAQLGVELAKAFQALGKGDTSALTQMLSNLGATVAQTMATLGKLAGEAFLNALKEALTPAGGFNIQGILDAIKADLQKFWDSLKTPGPSGTPDAALKRIQEQDKAGQQRLKLGDLSPISGAQAAEGGGADFGPVIAAAEVAAERIKKIFADAVSGAFTTADFSAIVSAAQTAAMNVGQAFAGINFGDIQMDFSFMRNAAQAVATELQLLFSTAGQQIAAEFSNIDISSALSNQIDLLIAQFDKLAFSATAAAAASQSVGSGGGGGAPAPGAPFARGGLLGGRGTGTSDSNLAWLSRGEYIMPARTVRQPGVLAFLEALRRWGKIPGFAGGGQAGGGSSQGKVGGGGSVRLIVEVDKLVDVINTNSEAIESQSEVIMELADNIASLESTVSKLAAPPSKARGGLLGGRGTGTSDSNLAWVSRGEHVMPARAVQQPGVLAFLEALRRSGGNLRDVLDGMGRFALGGMVPRAMMIPAFATGGLAGGMSNVTIAFPGLPPISGLRASSSVVDELQRAAALAQVRSGGRKPSRYS